MRSAGTPASMAARRVGWRTLAAVLGSGGIAYAATALVAPLRDAELWIRDLRFARFAPAEPQHEGVVVLAITEKTLEALPYRSPVDREFLAALTTHLSRSGVRAIGFDLFFDQPTEPGKDAALIEALRASAAPVTVAALDAPARDVFLTERQRAFAASFIAQAGVRPGVVELGGPGRSGVVREVWTARPGRHGDLESFVAAIARSVGRPVPDDGGEIVYRARPGDGTEPFAVYPLVPALADRFPPPAWLAGKIALVGAVRPFEDRHATPFRTVGSRLAAGSRRGSESLLGSGGGVVGQHAGDGAIAGVIIHAHALAQRLDGRMDRGTGAATGVGLCLLLAGLGAGLGTRDGSVWLQSAGVAFGGAVYAAAAIVALARGGVMLPVVAPWIALGVAFGFASLSTSRELRARQRFLRRAFSQFVSAEVVRALEVEPERLALGGERRELTFLFTDIAGFTTLSERLDPEVLADLVNGYLDGMVEILFRFGGTLDKFVGDAIVAMFGAPTEREDHAAAAVACALELDAFAEAFRERARGRGIEVGVTRIGVHTGPAAVGNFGAARQFNYTALGDAVNTAARLEGANKAFGTRICVSGVSAAAAPAIRTRPIGEVVVKGRSKPLAVFEPLAHRDGGECAFLVGYEAAYAALEKREVERARAALVDLAAQRPGDPLVALHLSRLDAGADGPVIVLETK